MNGKATCSAAGCSFSSRALRAISVLRLATARLVKLGAVAGTISASRPGAADARVWPRLMLQRPRPACHAGWPVAHAATLVAAFVMWAYLDRNLWFFGDEWDFLTRRGLHGAYFSIWAPHNEHWSVLPILLWRAIYSLEHLSSYWPYLVPLLLAHVVVVHLVWRRCLREGADPWVATALGLLFGFLGAGAENLAWAFQIGFVSSLLFGLLAMEVAEGRRSRGKGGTCWHRCGRPGLPPPPVMARPSPEKARARSSSEMRPRPH